jgi:hypothetical protein
MILRYLERFIAKHSDGSQRRTFFFIFRTNEAAKPTIALDYNYAKKPKNIDTVNNFYHLFFSLY